MDREIDHFEGGITTKTPPDHIDLDFLQIDRTTVREELHLRRIEMRGYRRSDGMYEVEGQLIDSKTEEFIPASGGRAVPAGDAIHDMSIRLVFDDDMVIRDVATRTRAAPYAVCPDGGKALQSLRGVRIGHGWSREVRSRLGGVLSCTHLVEMLIPLATTAVQSLGVSRVGRPDPLDAEGRPRTIDSCIAYAESGELVRLRWPQYHRST